MTHIEFASVHCTYTCLHYGCLSLYVICGFVYYSMSFIYKQQILFMNKNIVFTDICVALCMQAWSEGQAIRGHFSGFLSKINTSTPENSTRTPNHTDDDNDSTHPMTDTTFAEDVHTSLPALREPGQVILDHIVASHDAGQQRASHDAGQQRTSHDAGQPGVVSPGEVHKPIILNHSISLSECNLDSMTSASEGEVKLETRDGIDVIRVSRHSSMTLSESEALKQRKDKVVTGNQHITVSETDPLVSPAALQSNDDTNAPMAAGDSHSAYPIILVSARKTTS